MAVYTVIQDVEAEDKLIGFLTLKGFIYAAISGVSAFLEVRLLIAGSLGPLRWLLMLVFLGPMILFGVLASPLGREQPTEVWLLSRVKFFFKPHRRIWDQSGLNHLVTITAPKKLERQLTKNFSQTEVHSRLQALASTLDSRGWATKNSTINVGAAPSYLENARTDTDRLVEPSALSQDTPVVDIHAADDILDEQNNPTAQNFAALMRQADDNRKKTVADKINAARADGSIVPQPSGDTTFLDQQAVATSQNGDTTFVGKAVVAPGPQDDSTQGSSSALTADEKELLERLHREEAELESKLPERFRAKAGQSVDKETAANTSAKTAAQKSAPTQPIPVTPEMQAAKLELAQSGNDLSVASIAHLANRKNQAQQIGPNEFVIALH
jgi:hypothetical protein